MPDPDRMGGEQQCQYEGAGHLNVLRIEQHLLPVEAICEDAANQRKQHDRQLPHGEQIQAKGKGIFRQIVEPASFAQTAAQRSRSLKRTLPATLIRKSRYRNALKMRLRNDTDSTTEMLNPVRQFDQPLVDPGRYRQASIRLCVSSMGLKCEFEKTVPSIGWEIAAPDDAVSHSLQIS